MDTDEGTPILQARANRPVDRPPTPLPDPPASKPVVSENYRIHLKGHRVPKSRVSDYLEWFEDAYFLFTVRMYDASHARSRSNPKKIYCIDHAMVTSVSSGILVNSGHLLENLVFVALRRISPNIFYYRTRSGREVDFIVLGQDRSRLLIQVCESLSEPRTRKRELAALAEAMRELDLTTATLVSRNEEEQIRIDQGMIEVIPVWRFLLNLPRPGILSDSPPPGPLF